MYVCCYLDSFSSNCNWSLTSCGPLQGKWEICTSSRDRHISRSCWSEKQTAQFLCKTCQYFEMPKLVLQINFSEVGDISWWDSFASYCWHVPFFFSSSFLQNEKKKPIVIDKYNFLASVLGLFPPLMSVLLFSPQFYDMIIIK